MCVGGIARLDMLQYMAVTPCCCWYTSLCCMMVLPGIIEHMQPVQSSDTAVWAQPKCMSALLTYLAEMPLAPGSCVMCWLHLQKKLQLAEAIYNLTTQLGQDNDIWQHMWWQCLHVQLVRTDVSPLELGPKLLKASMGSRLQRIKQRPLSSSPMPSQLAHQVYFMSSSCKMEVNPQATDKIGSGPSTTLWLADIIVHNRADVTVITNSYLWPSCQSKHSVSYQLSSVSVALTAEAHAMHNIQLELLIFASQFCTHLILPEPFSADCWCGLEL